jgi:hypothetical protein
MLGTSNREGAGAKPVAEALVAVALLGCSACSSSGANASAEAGCASSGNYAPDASFDPIYACR